MGLRSNMGVSVIDFRLRYPDAVIYGFEPDPAAFALLQRNTDQDDKVVLHRVAVGREDGEQSFYSAQDTWASSFQPTRSHARITVETRRLDTLIEELGLTGIDLLKIDMEGGEADALGGFRNLSLVRWVVGEVHLEMLGSTAEELFDAHLPGFEVEWRASDGFCTFSAVAKPNSTH